MASRTYLVTVDVDGDIAMPTRMVQLGIETRLTGDGFTGRVRVVRAGPYCSCTWFDEDEESVVHGCLCGHLQVLHGPAGCQAVMNTAPYPSEVKR